MSDLRRRRGVGSRRQVLFVVMLTATLVACRNGGAGDVATIEFDQGQAIVPHVDGAKLVGATHLAIDAQDLPLSDAIATLHVVDAEPMVVRSYYAAGIGAAGWQAFGGASSEDVAYSMATNRDLFALIALAPSSAAGSLDSDAVGLPVPGGLGDGTTVIYTRVRNCARPTIDECLQAAFESFTPGVE